MDYKKILPFLIILFPISLLIGSSNNIALSFGPTLTWNFSSKKETTLSLGFEISGWSVVDNNNSFTSWSKGFDIGFEIENLFSKKPSKTNLYSEFQIGHIFYGFSGGFIVDASTGNIGIQSSTWGNFFGGVNLRYKYINDCNYFSPGVYTKMVLPIQGNWL